MIEYDSATNNASSSDPSPIGVYNLSIFLIFHSLNERFYFFHSFSFKFFPFFFLFESFIDYFVTANTTVFSLGSGGEHYSIPVFVEVGLMPNDRPDYVK